MKKKKVAADVIMVIILGIMSLATYWWTISLPIIGDGLMHLNDTTDLSSVVNLVKVFYTFDGVGKPENSATLGFHRPVFNEIIVTITKAVTHFDVEKIRFISILAFSVIVMCSYLLGRELFQSRVKAVILGILMNFSIIYYSGIYEYGLSFSIWLTLFVIESFYFTVKYVKYYKKLDLSLAVLFTLLAMYTKESAMCLGIALSWYVFINEVSKNRKITFKVWLYGGIQLIVLVVYLCTRYLKLGSLFTAVEVNAEKITLTETIRKIYGYYLLCFNIANEVIPDYMCARLTDRMEYAVMILILSVLAIYISAKGIYIVFKERKYRWDIISYIGMYVFLLVPVFKVNRNAPYYGDICAVCIFAFILTVLQFESKLNYVVCFVATAVFISVGISNMYVSTQEGRHYLSVQSNEAEYLKEQLQKIKGEINKDEVILTTNWGKGADSIFIYHHNGYGAFYKFNIDPSKKVGLVNDENIHDDASFIDFFKNIDTNELEVFVYPRQDTKLAKVTYGLDNAVVEIGFSYKGHYYYSNIDVVSKKMWSDDNCIYCVIPKECNLDVVGSDCDIQYIGREDM